MKKRPLIAITMGDPAGIGPEIIMKSLSNRKITSACRPVLIGNQAVFETAAKKLKKSFKFEIVGDAGNIDYKSRKIPIVVSDTLTGITKSGKWSKRTGMASYQAVKRAVELSIDKKVDAVVTAPISKEAWHASGMFFMGHTELIAKMTKAKHFSMMFFNGPFRLILATIHQPLRKVPDLITKSRVIQTGITGIQTLKKYFKIKNPHLAIAGLNPHAGEGGIIGTEERKSITPAIKYLSIRKKIKVSGPFPPDTLFAKAIKGKFDLILCMYHDQGLIPFKMLALHSGVNVTAGIPIIRTSPDHGTAFHLAGKNQANPGSMQSALLIAAQMAVNAGKI